MSRIEADDLNASAWLKVLQDRVSQLRFGVVQIVVHDSRVVQIEWTEKLRFDKPESEALRAIRRGDSASSGEGRQ